MDKKPCKGMHTWVRLTFLLFHAHHSLNSRQQAMAYRGKVSVDALVHSEQENCTDCGLRQF